MADQSYIIHHGDVRDVLKTFPDNHFHACLTDPPYELGFMGKQWDRSGIAFNSDVWSHTLRTLKPGASLLAFGGTRTYHRLTCAIEDAGFEVRDCLMWLYGQGFPKSHDIAKAMDRAAGAERPVVGAGRRGSNNTACLGNYNLSYDITAAATPDAVTWTGYGTALKPAWEPCVVAMKPVDGTYAQNALTHGVAGLNIDGSRIGTDTVGWHGTPSTGYGGGLNSTEQDGRPVAGRWPANLILDEAFSEFTWSRYFYCPKASTKERGEGNDHTCVKPLALTRYLAKLSLPPDTGSPRRLLVPFSGSGSEMIGALQAGWDEVVGIELDPHYIEIANKRISTMNEQPEYQTPNTESYKRNDEAGFSPDFPASSLGDTNEEIDNETTC